jgi:hypothetical protein
MKKRLLELIDRDDLIIEETDESLRLARRLVKEYGIRCPMPVDDAPLIVMQ